VPYPPPPASSLEDPLDEPLLDAPPDELPLEELLVALPEELLLELDELELAAPLDEDVAPLELPPPSSLPLLMTVPPPLLEEQAIAARSIDDAESETRTVVFFMGAKLSIARAAQPENRKDANRCRSYRRVSPVSIRGNNSPFGVDHPWTGGGRESSSMTQSSWQGRRRMAVYWQKPLGVQSPFVGGFGQSVESATGPAVPVYVQDFVHRLAPSTDAHRS
jgi:hypothetical protein